MRALRFAVEEAFRSLWRGRQAGLLSTSTIALALFVLGAFLLVTSNLERMGRELSRAAELSVYLRDEATPEQRQHVESLLVPASGIAGFEFLSKAEALVRFRQVFGDVASVADGLGENPLPASYEVRLRDATADRRSVDALATELRELPGVADVRFDRQWLDRLDGAIRVVRAAGVSLGALLALAAAMTVANVVRLGLYARRDELDIMALVGAPDVYVRGPFVMEGLLQGGIGALVSVMALAIAFGAVRARYLAPLATALGVPDVTFLPPIVWASLVIGGMVVGALGGIVAARSSR